MAIAERRAESRTRYYFREEAARVGWDTRHPSRGGHLLEEQEIVDYLPALRESLGTARPDFVALGAGNAPAVVIECKREANEIDRAIREAREYAETMNRAKGVSVKLAAGVAGTPDKRVVVHVEYLRGKKWVPLSSHGFPLSQFPSPTELATALENDDGTTDVQLPNEREFFDAAINISRMLRLAKIEEAVRPKVIGAVILALYQGAFSLEPDVVIDNINTNVKAAVKKMEDVPKERRDFLAETLSLSTESHSLRDKISDIVHQLERLNVRSIMRSGVDFLGQFYETFLRYGQDSRKLGVVFTPRHITRFCAELVDVRIGMSVYDPACGTGGFLVAAFDRMLRDATTPEAKEKVKKSLYGCDTNPTVWALAVLNMFFRGDGKSHITFESCFAATEEGHRFQRAMLNPPFSQDVETETDFVDHALKTLEPGGVMSVIVPATVVVDPHYAKWRRALVANHHVLAAISLPINLFYPVKVPTVILVVKAHAPDANRGTFVARIENDGFEVLKRRRVPIAGSQIQEILDLYREYEHKGKIKTVPNVATVVERGKILAGEEICAEQWLPSGRFTMKEYERQRHEMMRQMALAVANFPDVVDVLIDDYEEQLASGKQEGKPTKRAMVYEWFELMFGASSGEKNYPPGEVPYVSSGEEYNGITGFVQPPDEEIYDIPRLAVGGFGHAYVQPWRFAARGNGGSAVRVLRPRFGMALAELFWIAAQINWQRWRFHYGRMAVIPRLSRVEVEPPPSDLPPIPPLANKIRYLRRGLEMLTSGDDDAELSREFTELADSWEQGRARGADLAVMTAHPAYQKIIGMGERAVPHLLKRLTAKPGHWFVALHTITGANPVPAESEGKLKAMASAWLRWGHEQGYLGNVD